MRALSLPGKRWRSSQVVYAAAGSRYREPYQRVHREAGKVPDGGLYREAGRGSRVFFMRTSPILRVLLVRTSQTLILMRTSETR